MRKAAAKIKPKKGFANLFHVFLSALVPLLIYVFVQQGFVQLAVAVVLLGKWRMLAVRPRFWPANVRANAVDIIVGLSTIILMTSTASTSTRLLWIGVYLVWQVFIKPGRSLFSVSLQAIIGQIYGLMALFIAWPDASLLTLVAAGWAVCYLSARHYLTSFDEPYMSLYAHTWGYFAAALMWLSSHWLIFYGVVSQPALLLTVLGFGLGGLYYLNETDRLSIFMRRQIMFIMVAVITVILVFSDWGDKAI